MIIKNTGCLKDIKIDGIPVKLVKGINVVNVKDTKTIEEIVRLNNDLTILKELPKKEKKIEIPIDQNINVKEVLSQIPRRYKKGKKS